MNKISKILISAAGIALLVPLAAASSAPATYAFTCGIGQTAPTHTDWPRTLSGENAAWCGGAQAFGEDWQLASLYVSSGNLHSSMVAIGPGAQLYVPSYAVSANPDPHKSFFSNPHSTITRWYAGPGLVKKWSIPPHASAEVFVLPSHSGRAVSAAVTFDRSRTSWLPAGDFHYTVAVPALDLANLHQDLRVPSEVLSLSSNNSIPVRYRANEQALSRSPNGPWVKSIAMPAGRHASFFRMPANPGGLVLSATYTYPAVGQSIFLVSPNGNSAEFMVPAAPPPTLHIAAPAQRTVGQPIPATITIVRNGTPDAHALVTVRASIGRLSRESGLANAQGQIHVVITHAPAGRVIITATTGKARGRTMVHVIPKPVAPFPWWSLLGLLGLVLLGVLIVVASVRQRRRLTKQ